MTVMLTHIVTVFSVALSQKNFCSMGRILEHLHISFKGLARKKENTYPQTK